MARHVHLHFHDAGWDESKHPRKDDGKFGHGAGGAKEAEKGTYLSAAMTNAGKYASLESAKKAQAANPYPTLVLKHKETGHFLVPHKARQGNALVEAGHEVVLDYNGRPPEAEPGLKEHGQAGAVPADAPMTGAGAREHRHFAVETDKGTEYVSAKAVNGTGVGVSSAHTDELADYLQGKPKRPGEIPVMPAYRGRESGPSPGSKGESDLVSAGGPLSEKDKVDIEAFARSGGNEPRKLGVTKADLLKSAKAEAERAGKSDGSYYKAAQLYEQAGQAEKAAGARALALRYGHDPESMKKTDERDRSRAAEHRAQAERAATPEARAMLLEMADVYDQMVKERDRHPKGSDALTKRLRGLTDRVAFAEYEAKHKDKT